MNETATKVLPQKKPWGNPFLQRSKSLKTKLEEKTNLNGPVPEHIADIGNCHIWIAGCDPNGYGRVCLNKKNQMATRAVWEIEHGPIPTGFHILHHCDNPTCVRVSHLFLGTHADNMSDKARKRRAGKTLNWQTVIQIKEALAQCDKTQAEIARNHGTSRCMVNRIALNRVWIT